MVPKSNSSILKYVVIGVVALIVVIGGVVGYCTLGGGSSSNMTAVVADTVNKADSLKNEQAKKDSIAKAKKDSVSTAPKSKSKKPVGRRNSETGKKVEKKVDKKTEKKPEKEEKAKENKPKRLR